MCNGKVFNLEYRLFESQKQLSRNLQSQNGNLKFYFKKPWGLTTTPLCVCVGLCVSRAVTLPYKGDNFTFGQIFKNNSLTFLC